MSTFNPSFQFLLVQASAPGGEEGSGIRVVLKGSPGERVHISLSPPEGVTCHGGSDNIGSPATGQVTGQAARVNSAVMVCSVECVVAGTGTVAVVAPFADGGTVRCVVA